MKQRIRIESLTFLRFIAALVVVILHYGRKTDLADWGRPFITSGQEMVTFFFVLSGFVMLVAHYQKDNERLRDYYASRVARIAPVYFLALGMIVLLSSAKPQELILSATFLHAWVPTYPATLNTPSWSISVEMFFYLTFPLILVFINRYQIKTRHFWVLALSIYLTTQVALSSLMDSNLYDVERAFYHDIVYYFPISHYCSFLLGVAAGLLFVRHTSLFGGTGFIRNLIFLVAVFFTYYFLQHPDVLRTAIGKPLAYDSSFYALLFVILILAVSCVKNVVTAVLSLPILIFLGEISYSLYILQKPVRIIHSRYISDRLGLGDNLDFYAYLTLLIAISSITYMAVEKPCKSFILKLNRNASRTAVNKPTVTHESV